MKSIKVVSVALKKNEKQTSSEQGLAALRVKIRKFKHFLELFCLVWRMSSVNIQCFLVDHEIKRWIKALSSSARQFCHFSFDSKTRTNCFHCWTNMKKKATVSCLILTVIWKIYTTKWIAIKMISNRWTSRFRKA